MSAQEFRECIEYLGWTTTEVARRLDISERNARRMSQGDRAVRDNVAAWLRQNVQIMSKAPALPEGWRNADEDAPTT